MLKVNVLGAVEAIKATLGAMRTSGPGRIIDMAVNAPTGDARLGPVRAIEAAPTRLTRNLAVDPDRKCHCQLCEPWPNAHKLRAWDEPAGITRV